MLEYLKIIVIGIIEGITEWLQISSTGHMMLAEEILNLHVTDAYWKVFLVVIQLGAILAVVLTFWNRLWPFQKPDEEESGFFRYVKRDTFFMWVKIVISVFPAAFVGLIADDWIDAHFFNYLTIAVMLIFYGVVFIVVERRNEEERPLIRNIGQIDYKTAIMIGLFQVLALIPGTSRSGATIIGGLVLGLNRKTATEYTFFMAVPVMLGASLLKLIKYGTAFSGSEIAMLLLGMAVAFIVSMLTIRVVLGYIRTHDFTLFGWYRIVLGAVVFIFFTVRGIMA